jgi:hypothetical protein
MVFSLQKKMSDAEPRCARRTDRIQAVFYILFYRVIQEDAWEKAGEGGRQPGRGSFSSRDCFILNGNYSIV